MVDDYRRGGGSWREYERRFRYLMAERRIERMISPETLEDGCLLCSEHEPHRCHRQLVAEYLARHWSDVTIEHLR